MNGESHGCKYLRRSVNYLLLINEAVIDRIKVFDGTFCHASAPEMWSDGRTLEIQDRHLVGWVRGEEEALGTADLTEYLGP